MVGIVEALLLSVYRKKSTLPRSSEEAISDRISNSFSLYIGIILVLISIALLLSDFISIIIF